MEASLVQLPDALQLCKDKCYGPLRLGRRMGFAQVYTHPDSVLSHNIIRV